MVAISFVRALEEKYMLQDEVGDHLVLPKDKIISTAITFVGFQHVKNVQCQLARLKSIDLSGRHIEIAGDVLEFADRLRSVETLNLADNNLDWPAVVAIISNIPRLRELILTANKLADGFLGYSVVNLNRGLSCITLGRIRTDWTTLIRTLSCIWSYVGQIDLWDCSLDASKLVLSDSPSLDSFVKKISALKLSQNHLVNMQWLNSIGPLDSLRELDLSRCGLERISLDEDQVNQLRNLDCLNVSYNSINDWASFAELNKLPRLNHLLCHENPLYILDKFAKLLVIARLGQLKLLNRESVSSVTRRDAEILYVRKSHPEYQAYLDGLMPNFKSIHPRYERLVDLYGIPADLTTKQQVDKNLNVDLCFGNQRITKKLPCDMRVSNLQMLCKRLFRLKPSSKIEITCADPQCLDDNLRYTLDLGGQTLDFYSVRSGYELLISEVKK